MKRHATRTVMLAIALLATVAASRAAAQETTAEVRTWSGQSVLLAAPWLEVSYTLPPAGGEASAPPGGLPVPPTGAGGAQPEIRGSFQALRRAFEHEGPSPLQGRRETSVLTLSRGGVELKVPLERLAALTVFRQAVMGSSLPPYVSPMHQRYSATVTLTDGSSIDADYFNFGTAVLRGMTAQGRVDVPFEQIESVRFTR
jgi:hypothetical protein